jgi:endonuclease/exonuclease/phosphatase family metal-dependent hydrolase
MKLTTILLIILTYSFTVFSDDSFCKLSYLGKNFSLELKETSSFGHGPMLKVNKNPIFQQLERKLEDIQNLKMGTYNVRDFNAAKPVEELKEIASTLRELDLDIITFQEIGSLESLNRFNTDFLESKYVPLLIEGNDNARQIAFMVKKDLPFEYEVVSFKNYPLPNENGMKEQFTRDVPFLIVKNKKNEHLLSVGGVHLKSMMSKRGDTLSYLARSNEVEGIARVASEVKQTYSGPLVLMGDFNTPVNTAYELINLQNKNIFESFKLARTVKQEADHTHQMILNGKLHFSHLDAIMGDDLIAKHLLFEETGIYVNRKNGNVLPKPDQFDQLDLYPSDHLPVYVHFNLKKLLEIRNQR